MYPLTQFANCAPPESVTSVTSGDTQSEISTAQTPLSKNVVNKQGSADNPAWMYEAGLTRGLPYVLWASRLASYAWHIRVRMSDDCSRTSRAYTRRCFALNVVCICDVFCGMAVVLAAECSRSSCPRSSPSCRHSRKSELLGEPQCLQLKPTFVTRKHRRRADEFVLEHCRRGQHLEKHTPLSLFEKS